MSDEDKYLYRYEEVKYSRGCDAFDNPYPGYDLKVSLWEHKILRRTPKGVWIDDFSTEKFVLLSARKKFACETKEDALESFKRRKQKQIRILESQLEGARLALRIAENMKLK